ncbi:hypothetical protein C8R47DRAFT_1102780 [Mycena vitilis]|nr:hypothetical protein C8R47DRAFT_1102780 [Mycena vitilis]
MAMRIVLSISPYIPESRPQTEAERITGLVGEYLLARDGANDIVKAIRLSNRTKVSRGKGQTPKRWVVWCERIFQTRDLEMRVGHTALNKEIRNENITNLAVAAMYQSASPWTAKCMKAYALIKKRRLWPGVQAFLDLDNAKKDSLGIAPFLRTLEKFREV